MAETVRTIAALAVVALLARAAGQAWRARRLALAVWSGIRPRHVVGSLALLAVVLGVAGALLTWVPPARLGLGSLIGVTGNVVFAPVEEVSARTGGGDGADTVLLVASGAFFAVLLALFPFLAHAEERAFRLGLEDAGPAQELWSALRFGLAHLVMLVPVGAALAIAVAGWAYGRVYRHAHARAARDPLRAPGARAAGVLAATTWHATFNSVVVVLVWTSLLLDALAG